MLNVKDGLNEINRMVACNTGDHSTDIKPN